MSPLQGPRNYTANKLSNQKYKFWWEYSNDNELEEAINDITKIIITKGMCFLDKISIDIIKPSPELLHELFIKHNEYFDMFCNKHNLEIIINDFKNELLLVKNIDKLIRELDRDICEGTNNKFLCIAAFFGEMLVNNFNGNWKYNNKTKLCTVNFREYKINPLEWVLNYWNVDLDINSLLSCYSILLVQVKGYDARKIDEVMT